MEAGRADTCGRRSFGAASTARWASFKDLWSFIAAGADTCGRNSSRAASAARRSSSKNSGSFIAAEVGCAIRFRAASKLIFFFRLFFGLERLSNQFAVGFLQQNLDTALRFFELFLAFSRKLHAFLK